jgi:hypothetical protein
LFYFNQDSYQQTKLIIAQSISNQNNMNSSKVSKRLLASSYTMKLNILSEMKLAKNLLDAVYQSFFATLDANVSTYVILLCAEILFFAIIIPI